MNRQQRRGAGKTAGPQQAAELMAAVIDRHRAGRFADAIVLYRKLLRLAPSEPEPWYNLGLAQMQSEDAAAAAQSWGKAIALRPDYVAAWVNLGIAQAALAEPGTAEQSLRRAVELNPDLPEAHSSLAAVLGQLDRAAEGESCARRALELRPDDLDGLNNLGILLHQQGKLAEAEAVYRRAITLKPDFSKAHFNLSLTLLAKGDWTEGWAEREWRVVGGVGNVHDRKFPQPQWTGEDLSGKRILLYAEQGFGDSIQFLRYCAAVAARGAEVVVEVPRALVRLAATAPGVSRVVAAGDKLPPFDCHLALMSLPRLLGVTVENVQALPPYLTAPPSDWPKRLAEWPGRKVGLVWAGDARPHDPLATAVDKRRSLSLEILKPLLEAPGITFVSLQKGAGSGQLRKLDADLRPQDGMGDIRDFADTAALVSALDLVITVDTAVAHLAGALGRPVWLLSRFDGCWRWLNGRDDTPWYPSVRLFRQTAPGDWAGVVARLAAALAE